MPDTYARLTEIAAALREAGDRGNLNAMRRGLRTASAPLVASVHEAAMNQLPRSGGLNAQVAGQRVSVRTALGARSASVRLTTSAPDTAQTDSGYVRHPVFGRWLPNVPPQQIPQAAGWWSKTLEAGAPVVRTAIDAEIKAVADRIGAL